MGIVTKPQHKLVLEFNGSEMVRIFNAAQAEGLSMEAWAAAVVSIEAAAIALRGRRLKSAAASESSDV